MSVEQTATNEQPDTTLTRLVLREPERKLFQKEINLRRQTQQVAGSIINIAGTAGIGKSTLLREILRELLRLDYRDVPWTMVDLDTEGVGQRYLHPDEGPVRVLEDWLTDLARQTQVSTAEFSQALDEFYEAAKRKDLADSTHLSVYRKNVAKAFVSYIYGILKNENRSPVVLFLDTVEHASEDLITWLEKEILAPVTASGQVVCVLASRQEIDWQSFDVRKRVHFLRIEPFDEQQVAQQLEPSYSDLASTIIKLTFGLPAATTALATEIKKIQETEGRTPDQTFIQDHLERLVKEHLLEHLLYQHLMANVSEDLKETFLVMSPLRHFTVNIAAHMLPNFTLAYQDIQSGIQTLTVIRQMIETTLVEWDRTKRGYAMEEPLRRIMALAFAIKDYHNFMAVHTEAAALYAGLIAKTQENRSDHMIEWLYHQAHVLRSQEEQKIGQALGAGLKNYLEQYYVQDQEPKLSAIDGLYNQFQSDKVLQQELENIASGTVNELSTVINSYRK